MNADVIYFRRRALEERTAALSAADPEIRRIHLDLAHRYEGSVRNIMADERRQRFRLLEVV